ncbi:MAG TPA: GDSL-type esterase/lipase family protein [Steroidobacteraceae bacterium]
MRIRDRWLLGLGLAGLSVLGWETWSYRNRLHEYTQNERWETRLADEQGYGGKIIVFFGDSQLGYWPMAESFGSLPIINRGAFGAWAMNANARLEQDVLAFSPTAVVLMFGDNDFEHGQPEAEILANIEQLIDRMQERSITVILCGLLPASGHWLQFHSAASVTEFNERLRTVGLKDHVQFVDFYPLLADKRGEFSAALTRDGLHPNRYGYLRMTRELLPVIFPLFDLKRNKYHPAPVAAVQRQLPSGGY